MAVESLDVEVDMLKGLVDVNALTSKIRNVPTKSASMYVIRLLRTYPLLERMIQRARVNGGQKRHATTLPGALLLIWKMDGPALPELRSSMARRLCQRFSKQVQEVEPARNQLLADMGLSTAEGVMLSPKMQEEGRGNNDGDDMDEVDSASGSNVLLSPDFSLQCARELVSMSNAMREAAPNIIAMRDCYTAIVAAKDALCAQRDAAIAQIEVEKCRQAAIEAEHALLKTKLELERESRLPTNARLFARYPVPIKLQPYVPATGAFYLPPGRISDEVRTFLRRRACSRIMYDLMPEENGGIYFYPDSMEQKGFGLDKMFLVQCTEEVSIVLTIALEHLWGMEGFKRLCVVEKKGVMVYQKPSDAAFATMLTDMCGFYVDKAVLAIRADSRVSERLKHVRTVRQDLYNDV